MLLSLPFSSAQVFDSNILQAVERAKLLNPTFASTKEVAGDVAGDEEKPPVTPPPTTVIRAPAKRGNAVNTLHNTITAKPLSAASLPNGSYTFLGFTLN
ncbi:hypothetical protein CMV_015606 [Castanea mollissima]|uniref:Uncharacterized protein n=1 Tax=Castanea mollissima TaxID=60419 RepID=A0A8J4VSG6_9ROSI|nr:hypothetical protein CMV_015606 [Castanea mollissima]